MQLYLETDMSDIRLRASLLHLREWTQFTKDKGPDNSMLQPIVLTSKYLTSTEKHYSSTEREAVGMLHGFKYPNTISSRVRLATWQQS